MLISVFCLLRNKEESAPGSTGPGFLSEGTTARLDPANEEDPVKGLWNQLLQLEWMIDPQLPTFTTILCRIFPPACSRSRSGRRKGIRQPLFPAVASKCECDETSVNKSARLRHESTQLSCFTVACLFCRAAEVSQDFALCLAKWGCEWRGGVPASCYKVL